MKGDAYYKAASDYELFLRCAMNARRDASANLRLAEKMERVATPVAMQAAKGFREAAAYRRTIVARLLPHLACNKAIMRQYR